MANDLIAQLREEAECYRGKTQACLTNAADRIEKLEKALIHIWSWYPTNVSNPHQQINEMKDFAFKIIKEGKDD